MKAKFVFGKNMSSHANCNRSNPLAFISHQLPILCLCIYFIAALLMPLLCHSFPVSKAIDEVKEVISCDLLKLVKIDSSIAYAPILYHANGKLCWKDPKVYNNSSSYNNSGIVYYPIKD